MNTGRKKTKEEEKDREGEKKKGHCQSRTGVLLLVTTVIGTRPADCRIGTGVHGF